MTQAALLTAIAVVVGAVALTWYWLRLREDRGTSADQYVAQAKQRAQAELDAYLKGGGRRPN